MAVLHHGPSRHPDPVSPLYGDKSLTQLLLKSIERIITDIFHGLPKLVPGHYISLITPGPQSPSSGHIVLPSPVHQKKRPLRPQPYLLNILKIHLNPPYPLTDSPCKYTDNLVSFLHNLPSSFFQYM